MSTMTLERLRDWHRRVNQEWHTADLQQRMQLVVGFPHGAAVTFLDAHLAQPAQAVDVDTYKSLLAEAQEHHLACVKDAYNLLGIDGSDGEYRYKWVALEITKLTRALSEEKAGWQPIETAPQDGTRVLLWAEGKCRVGSWVYYPADAKNPVAPTYWQPLPASPTPDKEG